MKIINLKEINEMKEKDIKINIKINKKYKIKIKKAYKYK
jgi:hypothetical protein